MLVALALMGVWVGLVHAWLPRYPIPHLIGRGFGVCLLAAVAGWVVYRIASRNEALGICVCGLVLLSGLTNSAMRLRRMDREIRSDLEAMQNGMEDLREDVLSGELEFGEEAGDRALAVLEATPSRDRGELGQFTRALAAVMREHRPTLLEWQRLSDEFGQSMWDELSTDRRAAFIEQRLRRLDELETATRAAANVVKDLPGMLDDRLARMGMSLEARSQFLGSMREGAPLQAEVYRLALVQVEGMRELFHLLKNNSGAWSRNKATGDFEFRDPTLQSEYEALASRLEKASERQEAAQLEILRRPGARGS